MPCRAGAGAKPSLKAMFAMAVGWDSECEGWEGHGRLNVPI